MDIQDVRRRRLAQLIEEKYDGVQAKFVSETGQNQGEISALLKNKSFGEKKARKIEQACDLPDKWLDTPPEVERMEAAVYSAPERRAFLQNVRQAPPDVRPIPVISAVQAGRLKEVSDPYPLGAGFAVEYVDDGGLSRWTFGLEIEGNSMMPEFKPGDRVIIDPELAPNPGDYVVAKNTREEATFKKYRPRGMDKNGHMVFELVPLNDDYPTMRSDIEHLEVIGVMVEHRKKYRRNKRR
jgi:SOS-response transcriptional repressor LexA